MAKKKRSESAKPGSASHMLNMRAFLTHAMLCFNRIPKLWGAICLLNWMQDDLNWHTMHYCPIVLKGLPMSQRILIVDDDPVQRRLLEAAVKRFGYRSKSCVDGREALNILTGSAQSEIDLVILDLMMPEVDGINVLKQTRAAKNPVPVIVQTANGSIETVIEAMRAGAQDFVVKPSRPERLQVSITNLLKVATLEGEITRIRKRSEGTLTFDSIVTRSEPMERVLRLGKGQPPPTYQS